MRAFYIIAMYLVVAMPCRGEIIYVDGDATGASDGTSWENAYRYLQDALAEYHWEAQIRVAQGIYRPDQGGRDVMPGDRNAAFEIKDRTRLKGGYAGAGYPDPNARDIDLYETILSGDLSGDDAPYFAGRLENSYHVVRVKVDHREYGFIIDGVSITGGNADGFDENTRGGGIYCDYSGEVTVTGCTITDNFAVSQGGGMYNENGSATLRDCQFSGNYARSQGGGISNRFGSPILENCGFTGNVSNNGGAIFNSAGEMTLTRCTFVWNCAGDGGSISNNDSEATVTECMFELNRALGGAGGAMFNSNSSPIVTDCTFRFNDAEEGGGMANYYYRSRPTVAGCLFTENYASERGGGISNVESRPTLTGCIFSRNAAGPGESGGKGGAIYNTRSPATIANCTLVDNAFYTPETYTLGGYGDAIYSSDWNAGIILNCIVWDHTPEATNNEIESDRRGWMTVAYSAVPGGCWGDGNIGADPCFADPESGDYHLKSQAGRWDPELKDWVIDDVTSACIDGGDLMSPIEQEPFPNGGIVNMGAYGGSSEASKSYFGGKACEVIAAGDVNGDCRVNFLDFRLMALHWMEGR